MSRNPFDDISERLGRLLPEGAQDLVNATLAAARRGGSTA